MTVDSGQPPRDAEIAEYVEAVRVELSDLAPAARDELLEDLAAHLTEVAAEDPTPLRERLGPPAEYAAELRAATTAEPVTEPAAGRVDLLRLRWQRARERLRDWDARVGPWIGYERFSEFGRLLVPAWWLLRGYLAAMIVVNVLDRDGELGLLPRLGGSTLAGLIILAAFLAGSVWLGRRTPDLSEWPRRGVFVVSAFTVLIGLVGFVSVDSDQRYRSPTVPKYVVGKDPYADLRDVYVFDEQGRLLTGVTLLDGYGRPIHLGRDWCHQGVAAPSRLGVGPNGEPGVTYPRCPQDVPWWLVARHPELRQSPTPTPTPSATASAGTPAPTPSGSPTPAVTGSATPSPDVD